MNTLAFYNHNFTDFDTVFPSFGPLENVIKKVLRNRGIQAYSVNIVNDGWIRNHYITKEDVNGKYVALKKLPNFNEHNDDLGWLNKAKRTIPEMLENPPSKDLTTYFEIYSGLRELEKKYDKKPQTLKSSVKIDNYEILISEAKRRNIN